VHPDPVPAAGRVPRPPLPGQGLAAALFAGVLALAALPGPGGLVVAVLVLQLLLAAGLLALVEAPAWRGAAVIGVAASVAADVVALRSGDGRVGGIAGVVALSLVAALLHQLSRSDRARVTESLADTMLVVVLAAAAACLVALRRQDGGSEVLSVTLAAAAAALLAGRLGDRIGPYPPLALGATRGWPGLVLALGAGAAAAAVAAGRTGEVAGPGAVLFGLAVAAAVAAGDLAVDLAAAELVPGRRDARRTAALRPVALLLPYAVAGPIALLAGRLVLT